MKRARKTIERGKTNAYSGLMKMRATRSVWYRNGYGYPAANYWSREAAK
jgi:hypothetical protein